MDLTKKLSYQELNALFTTIAESKDTVLWISDAEFKDQIYLSESFEHLFNTPREVFYKDMSQFYEMMSVEDRAQTFVKNQLRINGQIDKAQSIYYRFNLEGDTIIPVKDTYFSLCKDDEVKAFVGTARQVSMAEWDAQQNTRIEKDLNQCVKHDISRVLDDIFGLSATSEVIIPKKPTTQFHVEISQQLIKITRKEAYCLQCLQRGVHTKHIADKLNISVRTVEAHFDSIRKKTAMPNRIALLSAIQNRKEIEAWVFYL